MPVVTYCMARWCLPCRHSQIKVGWQGWSRIKKFVSVSLVPVLYCIILQWLIPNFFVYAHRLKVADECYSGVCFAVVYRLSCHALQSLTHVYFGDKLLCFW